MCTGQRVAFLTTHTACAVQIYVYYKSMSRPIAQQDFSANPVCAGSEAAPSTPDAAQFISSVCWKPRTNTLLTANSSGVVKVMTLTHD